MTATKSQFRYVTSSVGRDGNPYDFSFSATPEAASQAEDAARETYPREFVGTCDADDYERGWLDLDDAAERFVAALSDDELVAAVLTRWNVTFVAPTEGEPYPFRAAAEAVYFHGISAVL